MATLRDIKKRIGSVHSTRQITRTMEMVSTAKIKKAQARIESARPYALAMMEVLGNVARFVSGVSHPLLEEHDNRSKVVIVVVTSDRGLCGAFNSNILRIAESLAAQEREAGAEVDIVAVGKKAIAYYRYRGVEPVASFRDMTDANTFPAARAIAEYVIDGYTDGSIDAVQIVFNRFKSVAEQKPEVHGLLPVKATVLEAAGDDLELHPEYLFEPNADAVLQRLLPTYVQTLIYRSLLESAAGEHGARRTAMKSATDNASEMIVTLTRSYNRARQAAITTEIAEIVGGAAALEED